ncbi:MAG TPA: uracil phosphoribosyltransferase [Bacteroidia bacterium]|nr:uracil phosphoribosyltransferase [Bacteroidia bacterium]HNT79171.1 uracil phosphoribosyltransferase [Bacteroidia bacterium]
MSTLHILNTDNSILNVFLGEIRDVKIQNDRMRFRRNLERIGEVIAYELSKQLSYETIETTTPLGIAKINYPDQQPVLATILRAGIPLHQGLLNYFDRADNAFVSAYRHHHKDGSFEIKFEYLSAPSLDNRIVIISDPMLATGSSAVVAFNALLEKGKPSQVHFVSAISSKQGIEYVKAHLPFGTHIWTAAVDEELTVKSYIVPGLGDAGDLAYGTKV